MRRDERSHFIHYERYFQPLASRNSRLSKLLERSLVVLTVVPFWESRKTLTCSSETTHGQGGSAESLRRVYE
jgi:hypothetical protein